jgi:hypothetical protein
VEPQTHILINVAGSGVVIFVCSFVFKYLMNKLSGDMRDTGIELTTEIKETTKELKADMKEMKADSMTKELCGERHDNLEDKLEKGDEHFKETDTKIDELKAESLTHSIVLSDVNRKMDRLLTKSGCVQ